MTNGPEIRAEYVPCDLCGSLDHDLLYTKTDPITRLDFHLVMCRCGMAFVNPMPQEDSIPLLYPTSYLEGKEAREDKYHKMLGLLPEKPTGKLLDIGCGKGDFIYSAARIGWDVEGVDVIDWGSPYPVPVRIGNFLAMDFVPASYDVVTAWAVLEHVRHPSLFLEKIAGLLKPDGRFIFVVPNVAAPGMKHSCAEDVPRHLWLFSPEAVTQFLERSGMEARAILHDGKIYQAYPFGLLRYAMRRIVRRETSCESFKNKSVALLRNRQLAGNLRSWMLEVLRTVGPVDLVLDVLDLAFGVSLAVLSRLIGNYGVITVLAGKKIA